MNENSWIDSIKVTKPLLITTLLALFLFGTQLLFGSSFLYCTLLLVFVFSTYIAVECLGGFSNYLSYYVIVYAGQHVIACQVLKSLYRQAADARLDQPIVTMGAYIATMLSFALGGWIYRSLFKERKKVVFEPITSAMGLRYLTIVCLVLSIPLVLLPTLSRNSEGATVGGSQVILFASVGTCAVAAGTAHAIVSSRGKSTFDPLSLVVGAIIIIAAFVTAARQGFLVPVATYFATCWAFGYKFKLRQYVVIGLIAAFAQMIIFPWAHVARGIIRQESAMQALKSGSALLVEAITDPAAFRRRTSEQSMEQAKSLAISNTWYFGQEQRSYERYSLIRTTDLVIDNTLKTHPWGWTTIGVGVKQLAPTVLAPDKLSINTSNLLAHRAQGLVGTHDHTTSISGGITLDAFSAYEWYGVAIIPMVLIIFYQATLGMMVRLEMKRNVFLLATFFQGGWAFAEGAINTHILASLQGFIIMFVMFGTVIFLSKLLQPRQRQWSKVPSTGESVEPAL